MIQILGEMYYIDLDRIEEYLDITDSTPQIPSPIDDDDDNSRDYMGESISEKKVNLIKFELVKMMLDTILSEDGEMDEKLGNKSTNNLTIPFKLAFNSLLNKKIINHY